MADVEAKEPVETKGDSAAAPAAEEGSAPAAAAAVVDTAAVPGYNHGPDDDSCECSKEFLERYFQWKEDEAAKAAAKAAAAAPPAAPATDEAKGGGEEVKDGDESKSCCPAGSLPALTEDTSRALNGTVEMLPVVQSEAKMLKARGLLAPSNPPPDTEVKCYISRPAKGKENGAGVIVLYDVHGFSGGRIKGVCDSFAEAGYLTIMPDVYGGTNITDQGGFGSETGDAFLTSINWAKIHPELNACARYMDANGAEVVGAAGFCWGAWPVFKYAATGEIAAGVCCHPSLRVGNLFHGETEDGLASQVLCPQLLMPASNDPAEHYGEDGSVVAAVRAAHDAGLACETHTFADMQHGWVPRGDASDPNVARDVEAALARACAFFEEHMLTPTRFDAVHRHQDRMDVVVCRELDAKQAKSKADVEALFAKKKAGATETEVLEACTALASTFKQSPISQYQYAMQYENPGEAEKVGNPLPDFDPNDPMWAEGLESSSFIKKPFRPHYMDELKAAAEAEAAAAAAAEAEAAGAEGEGDEKKGD